MSTSSSTDHASHHHRTLTQAHGSEPHQWGEQAVKRDEPLPLDILVRLPKAELHCHLDGSVRLQTILDLAVEQGIQLPTGDGIEALKKVVCVPQDCPSLAVYLQAFNITLMVLQESYALTRVMYEVCQDASLDGVRYLEVRFSPILHMRKGLSLAAVMEAVCEGVAYANHNLSLTVGVIVCGMRQLDPSVTSRLAEICWRYRGQGVCGFDLAGPEDGFSSTAHAEAFAIVRNKMINCTLHSGEAAGVQSILDSLSTGANRLGHGVRLMQDPKLVQLVADREIAIESCVTSNVQTKAIDSLALHPIRTFFDAGVVVVPCCDNWTVSQVTLSSEYDLIQRTYGFTPKEILRLVDNGFRSSFQDATKRHVSRMSAFVTSLQILRQVGYNPRELADHPQFFDLIGVEPSNSAIANLFGELLPTELTLRSNPPVTTDLIRALPKTDLHCRFSGSVSAAQMWREIELLGPDDKLRHLVKPLPTSQEELQQAMLAADKDPEHVAKLKKLCDALLVTPEQVLRGYTDVVQQAARDGISYLELAVRPFAHVSTNVDVDQYVRALLAVREALAHDESLPLVGIVLVVNPAKDCPMSWYHIAELCVQYREAGVCGLGVYSAPELQPDQYHFFRKTFSLLERHHIRVSIFAGSVNVPPVISALHVGHASRISAAFAAHSYPRLLDYLATHNIPVEISESSLGNELLRGLSSFAGSPFRYLFDARVPIVFCSFRNSFSVKGRVEIINDVLQAGDFDVHAIISVLSNGFRFNFQPLHVRQAMFSRWQTQMINTLKEHGFQCFSRQVWQPHRRFIPTRSIWSTALDKIRTHQMIDDGEHLRTATSTSAPHIDPTEHSTVVQI